MAMLPPLKVNLRAELEQPPVQDLRRMSPVGVVGAEDRHRCVAVEDVVYVRIELHAPLLAEVQCLRATQIQLTNPRPEERVRLDERDGNTGRAARERPAERRLNLRQ